MTKTIKSDVNLKKNSLVLVPLDGSAAAGAEAEAAPIDASPSTAEGAFLPGGRGHGLILCFDLL